MRAASASMRAASASTRVGQRCGAFREIAQMPAPATSAASSRAKLAEAFAEPRRRVFGEREQASSRVGEALAHDRAECLRERALGEPGQRLREILERCGQRGIAVGGHEFVPARRVGEERRDADRRQRQREIRRDTSIGRPRNASRRVDAQRRGERADRDDEHAAGVSGETLLRPRLAARKRGWRAPAAGSSNGIAVRRAAGCRRAASPTSRRPAWSGSTLRRIGFGCASPSSRTRPVYRTLAQWLAPSVVTSSTPAWSETTSVGLCSPRAVEIARDFGEHFRRHHVAPSCRGRRRRRRPAAG